MKASNEDLHGASEPVVADARAPSGFDPYDSGMDLTRLGMQRRRTLDDMRRLDAEIRRERAQNRFRLMRGDLPRG